MFRDDLGMVYSYVYFFVPLTKSIQVVSMVLYRAYMENNRMIRDIHGIYETLLNVVHPALYTDLDKL